MNSEILDKAHKAYQDEKNDKYLEKRLDEVAQAIIETKHDVFSKSLSYYDEFESNGR